MKYILSVMASPVSYTIYKNVEPGSVPPVMKKIRIEGGAGIPSSRRSFGHAAQDVSTGIPLWTPDGVVTAVSDADFALLEAHKVFKKHLEADLVKVLNSDITSNHGAVEKIAKNMAHDQFRPLNGKTIGNVNVKLEVE